MIVTAPQSPWFGRSAFLALLVAACGVPAHEENTDGSVEDVLVEPDWSEFSYLTLYPGLTYDETDARLSAQGFEAADCFETLEEEDDFSCFVHPETGGFWTAYVRDLRGVLHVERLYFAAQRLTAKNGEAVLAKQKAVYDNMVARLGPPDSIYPDNVPADEIRSVRWFVNGGGDPTRPGHAAPGYLADYIEMNFNTITDAGFAMQSNYMAYTIDETGQDLP